MPAKGGQKSLEAKVSVSIPSSEAPDDVTTRPAQSAEQTYATDDRDEVNFSRTLSDELSHQPLTCPMSMSFDFHEEKSTYTQHQCM